MPEVLLSKEYGVGSRENNRSPDPQSPKPQRSIGLRERRKGHVGQASGLPAVSIGLDLFDV